MSARPSSPALRVGCPGLKVGGKAAERRTSAWKLAAVASVTLGIASFSGNPENRAPRAR